MRTIPYSRQRIDEDDIEAVVRVLRSDWLTQGPDIEAFEQAVADYCSAAHAVAAASATACLHIGCVALGINERSLVWTSPLSFVASANCARYCGAEVDFVDIDMSMAALAAKLEDANRMPDLVIPVHYAGRACDREALLGLKARYGFKVMEDAAHALGAAYADGGPIGSNGGADAVVFSFHPVKPVTTGEGGVIVTHDVEMAARLRCLRSHGITRDAAQLEAKDMPAWYYEQQELGYHYRITDLQAALGVSQMAKLDHFITARRAAAARYAEGLEGLPLRLPPPDGHCGWHLYAVQVEEDAALSRDMLFEALRGRGIGVNVHYIPIHLQPYYRAFGFAPGAFPQAEAFYARCLSLPVYPSLSETDQDIVIAALRELLKAKG